jgi:hypothetical protein
MEVCMSRYSTWLTVYSVAGIVALAAAQPPNDPCTSPTAITGNGPFSWTLTGATVNPGHNVFCNTDIQRDVWFCWTATCDGQVTLSTCGQTTADTVIGMYHGCNGCPPVPDSPICCNDDEPTGVCGRQSEVVCNVVCGERYMIRIADKVLGNVSQGTFTITCTVPCGGGGHDCPPGQCCGGKPRFVSGGGPVSVTTSLDLQAGAPQIQVIDLAASNSAPAGANWVAAPFSPAHPSWSQASLGNVFGVAIDSGGNIYVAHTSVYGTTFAAGVLAGPFLDAVGTGGPGAIYKINTNTGAASVFTTLPNFSDPIVAASLGVAQSFPGIGNISIDCGRDTLFATNFEDGRIYRIALSSGTVLSAFDHASNTVTGGGAPEPGDVAGFVRLGERLWGVEPHNGRVYYTVFGTDTFRAAAPNTVWSIACDTNTGEFLPSTRRQEALTPSAACSNNPFSDLAFTQTGSMMLAQRSMGDPDPTKADTLSWAHTSCLLEFNCNPATGGWDPSPNTFGAGNVSAPRSAAGGVDVDFRPGQSYNYYATADALIVTGNPPNYAVYGLVGLPATGGGPANSLNVDLDGDTTWPPPKTQLGSVEVSCQNCAEISDEEILCQVGPAGLTGCYTYTFTLTNNSGNSVQYILIPDSNITPNVIGPFSPSALDPGESTTVTVTICNVPPGPYSFPIILMDTENDVCCNIDHEVDIPDCCFNVLQGPDVVETSPGVYSVTMKIQPLLYAIAHVFLAYEPCTGGPAYNVTIMPTYIPVNTPIFGSQPIAFTVTTNAGAGAELCFRMTIHTADIWECCSDVFQLTLPGDNGIVCPGDVDGDLDVDLTDLAILLANFGQGGAVHSDGDLDNDGFVTLADLSILLAHFGAVCY